MIFASISIVLSPGSQVYTSVPPGRRSSFRIDLQISVIISVWLFTPGLPGPDPGLDLTTPESKSFFPYRLNAFHYHFHTELSHRVTFQVWTPRPPGRDPYFRIALWLSIPTSVRFYHRARSGQPSLHNMRRRAAYSPPMHPMAPMH